MDPNSLGAMFAQMLQAMAPQQRGAPSLQQQQQGMRDYDALQRQRQGMQEYDAAQAAWAPPRAGGAY